MILVRLTGVQDISRYQVSEKNVFRWREFPFKIVDIYVQGVVVFWLGIQHNEPFDPPRCLQKDERSREAWLERFNPLQRRFAGDGRTSSSSSTSSLKDHSMDGKAIESSTSSEASWKTLISKDSSDDDLDRFKDDDDESDDDFVQEKEIIGLFLLITGVGL